MEVPHRFLGRTLQGLAHAGGGLFESIVRIAKVAQDKPNPAVPWIVPKNAAVDSLSPAEVARLVGCPAIGEEIIGWTHSALPVDRSNSSGVPQNNVP
jgi:hypothetical protein